MVFLLYTGMKCKKLLNIFLLINTEHKLSIKQNVNNKLIVKKI